MLKSGLSGPLFISGFDFSESSTVQEASNAPVITDEYRRMQQAMHEDPNFGVASVGYAPYVAQVLARANATEFLDYGAGKGRLGEALKTILKRPLKVHHYDPAVPQWAAPPAPCKFVACIDVLEHIEPDLLQCARPLVCTHAWHSSGDRAYRAGKETSPGRAKRPPNSTAARLVVAKISATFRIGELHQNAKRLLRCVGAPSPRIDADGKSLVRHTIDSPRPTCPRKYEN